MAQQHRTTTTEQLAAHVKTKLHPIETQLRLILTSSFAEGFTLRGEDLADLAVSMMFTLEDTYNSLKAFAETGIPIPPPPRGAKIHCIHGGHHGK